MKLPNFLIKKRAKSLLLNPKLISLGIILLLVAVFLVFYPSIVTELFKQIYVKAQTFSVKYHVNFVVVLVVFLACEVLFNAGWILMLIGSGITRIRLSDFRKKDFKRFNYRNKTVKAGFILNLLGASVSWLYLIVVAAVRFPWGLKIVSIAPILWELSIVFSIRFPIALAIFTGRRKLQGL